jgi:hypothetical protein
MAERDAVPAELRARLDDAAPATADARALAHAATARLDALLDLIAAGRGVREAGSGLNPASSELLVADALLTEAAALAAADGAIDDIVRELQLERIAERAREIDEAAQ